MTSVCTVTMTSACRVPQTAVQRAAGAWSLWPGRSSSAWRPTGASVRRRPGKAQEDGDGPRRAGPATQGTQACPGVATRGLPSPSRARGPDRCARGRGLETAESSWVPAAQAGASGGGLARLCDGSVGLGLDALPAWLSPGWWVVLCPWVQTEPAAAEHPRSPGGWAQGSGGDGDRVSSPAQASLGAQPLSHGAGQQTASVLFNFLAPERVRVLKRIRVLSAMLCGGHVGSVHTRLPEGGTCSKNLNYQ